MITTKQSAIQGMTDSLRYTVSRGPGSLTPTVSQPYTSTPGSKSAAASLSGMELFSAYYEQILSMMNVPTIGFSMPSRANLQKDFESSMRPSVDLAIKNRRTAGERTSAELDADAAARGMTGSSFLSSMKEREGDDVEGDIATLESQYSSALAERIQEAMMQYQQMNVQAQMFNAQAQQTAASTAMGIASNWYTMYLSSQKKSSTGSRKSSKTFVYDGLTLDECNEYAGYLSNRELRELFNSDYEYWAKRRAEIQASLGDGYNAFRDRQMKRIPGVKK